MSCQWAPDYPLAGNVTFSQFSASLLENILCPSTYLRPDPGGAILPFLYALFLLLFHLPACLIRAVRWESAQYLALGLALFNICVTVQSYISTKLQPSEVLVWMPLILILDIGAMLQMVILILELPGHEIGRLKEAIIDQVARVWNTILDGLPRFHRRAAVGCPQVTVTQRCESNVSAHNPQQLEEGNYSSDSRPSSANIVMSQIGAQTVQHVANDAYDEAEEEMQERKRKVLVGHAFVALLAAIFGIMLLVLQIYGLAAAKRGMGATNLTVKWCSPTFRDFAVSVTTGNCAKYEIMESSSNGIGCIALPASQQEDWLKGTFATLLTCLVLQIIDVVIVKFARRTNEGQDRLVNGTRLRRPWCSMFGGTLILIILIYYGADTANRLPPGVTDLVWIYRKDPQSDAGRVCQVHLKSPGLRGMIIGWSDGLFSSWGSVYNGKEIITAVRGAIQSHRRG